MVDRNGFHGNTAMRMKNDDLSESDKPVTGISQHMSSDEEYIVKINHLQFGGPLTREELLSLRDEIDEVFEEVDD